MLSKKEIIETMVSLKNKLELNPQERICLDELTKRRIEVSVKKALTKDREQNLSLEKKRLRKKVEILLDRSNDFATTLTDEEFKRFKKVVLEIFKGDANETK